MKVEVDVLGSQSPVSMVRSCVKVEVDVLGSQSPVSTVRS